MLGSSALKVSGLDNGRGSAGFQLSAYSIGFEFDA